MKYYIIAGEASGDLHAANLMRNIKEQDADAQFRCWGGEGMQAQGATLVKHYKDMAFMGFVEVLMNIRTISGYLKQCKQDISSYQPDAVILVDYPGFNLRMAAYAKSIGLKVFYYISPQVWAWKQSRVKKIKKVVDQLYVILPFEEAFYAKFQYPVNFVGHPLLDVIQHRKEEKRTDDFRAMHDLTKQPIIALLPGSRTQEIKTMLPLMLSVKSAFPDYQFVVAGAPSQSLSFYQQLIADPSVKIVQNQTYDLLEESYAALVTSGTATLETALFKVPEVVCYKGSWISYFIARLLIKVSYISLVNLVMDREIVKELIQGNLNKENIQKHLSELFEEEKRRQLVSDYESLAHKLGGPGASKRTADSIVKNLRS